MNVNINKNGQAVANKTIKITDDAFLNNEETAIYWLGGGGAMIHSYQTNIMIDPVLEGFDMPLLYDIPILASEVKHLDAVLVTHIDNDHFSKDTCHHLKDRCDGFYGPGYVGDVMVGEGLNAHKMSINEEFDIKDLHVTLTRALHNWQNNVSKWQYRFWDEGDYCGYEIKTRDGIIWMPGDSKLLEEQLHREAPNVILFDFADNEWHITFDGAIKLANAYPNAQLICIHWGCVDAPTMSPFNANPIDLYNHVINPERIQVLSPGEKYVLKTNR